VRVASPSLLRTFDPPLSAANGRRVTEIRRIGKRVVLALEPPDDPIFLVIHLMITGRLRWKPKGAAIPRKRAHAAFDFDNGTMLLTEAATKKRASLHVVGGEAGLAEHDRGGIEPLEATVEAFTEALLRENRTLKRALTDPRIFSGIGNAHSDEILHEAGLSPARRTSQLTGDEIASLHEATQRSLEEWVVRLREETGSGFPEKITAFHPAMRVHGRYNEPCPRCGAPIQRIVYASNETNYCARCQTGGKLLADRAFSRLLKEDWPRSLEDLEE
jgi:formamidopyrimidine-DNA glycosylase